MDQNNPITNPQSPESQDDGGELMRMEKRLSVTSEEQSQEDPEPTPQSPTLISRYYSVMDDEGPDEVFIQPPSLPFRLDPEGGSTCEAATDLSVTTGPSDATEANANPECLDWHHGEKHLMTAHSQVNEEMESPLPTFEEATSSDTSSGIECSGQEQTLMEAGLSFEDTLVQDYDYTSEYKGEECDDFGIQEDQMVNEELLKSSVDTDPLKETESKDGCQILVRHEPAMQDLETVTEDTQNKMEATLNQRPDIFQGESNDSDLPDTRSMDRDLMGYDWVRRTSEEHYDEGLSNEQRGLEEQDEESEKCIDGSRKIATEIQQGENLLQRLQLVQQRQDLSECQSSQKQTAEEGLMEEEGVVREGPEIIQGIHQQQEHTDQEPKVESPLSTLSAQFKDCRIDKTEEDIYFNKESGCLEEEGADEATSHQSEEEDVPESQCTPKQTFEIEQLTKEWSSEKEWENIEGTVKVDEEKTEDKNFSINEDDDQETKQRTSLPTLSAQNTEADCIEETDTWKSMAPVTIQDENRIPFPSCHRFSAAETFIEKQFQEALQRKQDLQRAGGVFDLSDNPDVLEIPFKTNISLEPLPVRESPGQRGDWQFSEQKMQKEISQEMQRELVMVNQGKIPGGYSKGECRQMKDTKLLFEAFQQDNMEGPTRIRKPQSNKLKSQVYPSVLERTRSLEMFSHKVSPILRTHSFRLVSSTASEKEIYPENLRSQSPSGSSRDKARLSPYRKHEKHTRMHKSMDSISTNSSTSIDKMRWSEEPTREGSPLLKENPFFKLRPALSLQPEVEKDIREAKKREEELRKQRSTLYGETKESSKEDVKSTLEHKTDPRQKATGKLERVWPPPSKKDLGKSEQQEAKVQRGAGHRAPLWQRWESGLINRKTPAKDNNS